MNGVKFLFVCVCLCFCAALAKAQSETTDNVIVTVHKITYTVKGVRGTASEVKVKEEITFKATRTDAKAFALTSYDDVRTIDKASAPGAKPMYRSALHDEIFYDDTRLCFLEVPVKAGKTATAVFEQTIKDPRHFNGDMFYSPYFTEKYTIEVLIEPTVSEHAQVRALMMPADAEHLDGTASNGYKRYIWTINNLPAYKREKLAAKAAATQPIIVVNTEFASVDQLYGYMHQLCGTEELSAAVEKIAKQATSGAPDQLAAIDSVAGWVRRNIRYVAIEHGDYGCKPASAASVLEKRYGDCKGSANLIRWMLRSIGVDARLAWVGTKDSKAYDWSDSRLPSAGNHMIAAAVLPDTIIYLDGTTGWQPRGWVPWSIQGREAIIEDGETYMLRRIPTLPASASVDSSFVRLRIAGKDLVGYGSTILTGTNCSSFENSYASIATGKRQSLLEAYVSAPERGVKSDSLTRERIGGLDGPEVKLGYGLKITGKVKAAGDAVYVSADALRSFAYDPVETKDRRHGLRMHYPERIVSTSIIELPAEAANVVLPATATIDNQWFAGAIAYSIQDGQIVCDAWIETRRIDADLEEIPEWNAAVKEIRRLASRTIKINMNATN